MSDQINKDWPVQDPNGSYKCKIDGARYRKYYEIMGHMRIEHVEEGLVE